MGRHGDDWECVKSGDGYYPDFKCKCSIFWISMSRDHANDLFKQYKELGLCYIKTEYVDQNRIRRSGVQFNYDDELYFFKNDNIDIQEDAIYYTFSFKKSK